MSLLTVSPSEIQFSLNNVTQFKIYMIYADVYLEIGQNYKFGIGKTTPTEDIHIGGNMHLNNPLNVTYNSGFKITVNNSPLAFVPIGTIVLWPVPNTSTVIDSMTLDDFPYLGPSAGTSYNCLPRGWVFCEGQFLSRTQFAALYNTIGNVYGSSGNNFQLPDFRGGYGIVNRNTADGSKNISGKYDRSGDNIASVTLTAANLPNHRHFGTSSTVNGANRHRHSQTRDDWSRNAGGGGGGTTSPNYQIGTTGNATLSHNHNGITATNLNPANPNPSSFNLEQPFTCLRYIIRIF